MQTKINGWIEDVEPDDVDDLMNEFIELVEKYGGTLFSTWVSDSRSGVADSPDCPCSTCEAKRE